MTTTPNGLLLTRPNATPPICPISRGLVRFGGLIMTTERARRIAQQLLVSCNTADDTPAAPRATARPNAGGRLVSVTLAGLPTVLTLDEAMILLGELRAAIVVASE